MKNISPFLCTGVGREVGKTVRTHVIKGNASIKPDWKRLSVQYTQPVYYGSFPVRRLPAFALAGCPSASADPLNARDLCVYFFTSPHHHSATADEA